MILEEEKLDILDNVGSVLSVSELEVACFCVLFFKLLFNHWHIIYNKKTSLMMVCSGSSCF